MVVELEPCLGRGAELRDLLARAAYRVIWIRVRDAVEPWHNGLTRDIAFEALGVAFLGGGCGGVQRGFGLLGAVGLQFRFFVV